MKASLGAAGEKGTSVVDLTLSSDDEGEGDEAGTGGEGAKAEPDAGVAHRVRDIVAGALVDAGCVGPAEGSSAAAAAAAATGSVAAGRSREEVEEDEEGSAKRAKC